MRRLSIYPQSRDRKARVCKTEMALLDFAKALGAGEYIRNTTARAFSVVPSALDILTPPFPQNRMS